MNIGIVGSRTRMDIKNVNALVKAIDKKYKNDRLVIISGGCHGVDRWAEYSALQLGIPVIIHKPDLKNIKDRADMVSRYYARNKKIAEDSDILYAFVAADRKGGTENTIKWMEKLGKGDKVFLR